MKRNLIIITSLILIILIFGILVDLGNKKVKDNDDNLDKIRVAEAILTSRTYSIVSRKPILK